MTDTKSKPRRDTDHPAPTGKADTPPAGPAPAVSFAGSGVTDPVTLNPETHGAHYRNAHGDM